jgi:pyrroline-5-carboxylate reductase
MKIGFIGCGKMASALVKGLVQKGRVRADQIWLSDAVGAAVEGLAKETGAHAMDHNLEVAARSEVVVLCVKPGDALAALEGVQGALTGKLLVSIAAGVSLAALESAAGPMAKVVRVMPNTPAMVHAGASAYALGKLAAEPEAELVECIFGAVGTVFRVKESLLDAVTGLSGSGPAYVYLMVEALSDGGVLMGLPRDLALQLAAQTVVGAARMVQETGMHPAVLRDLVASPGGTTIAGLEVLEAAGMRSGLMGAVRAATERSRELGQC